MLVPRIVEAITIRIGPGAGDELDVRVLGLDRLGEWLIPLEVLWAPLFIAHAEHRQVEWLGMPHRRALGAPCARRGAVGKLNEFQRVLNERFKLIDGTQLAGVELTPHAAVQDWQRLCADVFAELKVLKEPQP